MANDGKKYENFVCTLQQILLRSNIQGLQTNITIERNKKIKDSFGNEREFDLYWEYELGGFTYKTVIECKDYENKINVEKIDALVGKLRDFPGFRGIFATKTGYQSGAESKAKANNIDILIVREQNDEDWQDKNGNSLLRKINLEVTANYPPEIISFIPEFDVKWFSVNYPNSDGHISLSANTDQIFIEDKSTNSYNSLLQIQSNLPTKEVDLHGYCLEEISSDDLFICWENHRYKVIKLCITYIPQKSSSETSVLDFTKSLIGVIEYLDRSKKAKIFNDGKIVYDEL